MSTISSFKSRENKHDIYGGKACMKKLFEPLSEHKMEIINFKKKKKEAVNKRTVEIIPNCKICFIWKEKFEDKHVKDKQYRKDWHNFHYTGEYRGAHSKFNLKYSVPKEISIVFHNGSN